MATDAPAVVELTKENFAQSIDGHPDGGRSPAS